MKCQTQRKAGDDHVHETQVQDALRVSVGRARIGEQHEGRQHAHGGDRIAQRRAEPHRPVALHRQHREASEDGSDDPQAGRDERHDAEAGGGFPKEIIRKGSRLPTRRSCLCWGCLSRRPYQFLDLHRLR